MATSYFRQPLSVKLSFTTLVLACAGMAIFAAILMTEPGQMLNLNRDWIISYYQHKWLYGVLDLALFAGVVYLGLKHRIWRPVYFVLAGARQWPTHAAFWRFPMWPGKRSVARMWL